MDLCFAPMDWITNCATRLITSQIFEKYWKIEDSLNLRTEFMNVDWFLINPHQVIRHALTIKNQKPILQIYGWKEETLVKATEKIQNAIFELDEISKEVISLKYIEEKSYGEISKILWISQDSVRQRCSRALKALKIKLWQD